MDSVPIVSLDGCGGMLGKLVIELTQKDASYNAKTWAYIIGIIGAYLKNTNTSITCYLLALILKLALCCYNKMEQKAYNDADLFMLKKLWFGVAESLLANPDKEDQQKQQRELAILFLLQTILKEKNEETLINIFFDILSGSSPAESHARLFDFFLKVLSALNSKTEVMISCSEFLSSILLKGTIVTLHFDFANKDVPAAFNKLASACIQKQKGMQLLSLDNLLSIDTQGINLTLIEQLLSNPHLILYPEENKIQYTNYFLKALLEFSLAPQIASIAESLQQHFLWLCQLHTSATLSNDIKANQYVYLNAVMHMYTLFLDNFLTQGQALGKSEEITEAIINSCFISLKALDCELQHFFELILNEKKDIVNMAKIFKDLTQIYGAERAITNKLGLKDVDISFIVTINDANTMGSLTEKVVTDWNNKLKEAQKHIALLSILEFHYSTHIKVEEKVQGLSETCKMIISSMQLIYCLARLSQRLFATVSQKSKEKILKLLSNVKSNSLISFSETQLKSSIIELSKILTQGKPENFESTISGLIVMEKTANALKCVLDYPNIQTQKEIILKIIDMFLDVWKVSANLIDLSFNPDAIIAITNYDFVAAVKNLATIIETVNTTEIILQVMLILWESIGKKDKLLLSVIQTPLLKMSIIGIQEMLKINDPNHHFHNLLHEIIPTCEPLQQKVFTILVDSMLTNPNMEQHILKEHLKLLDDINTLSKEKYAQALIDSLLPAIQNCQNNSTQELLLNYLSGISYSGMKVTYPKHEIPSKKQIIEVEEDAVEGYNVVQYIKKDESLKPGTLCTYVKTRRKAELQPGYLCYTCNIVENKMCCSICAKTCHKNHKVAFSKIASFTCECHNETNCISLPKDTDSVDSDNSFKYYTSSFRKNAKPPDSFGFFEKDGHDVIEDMFPPPVIFGKSSESVRAKEQEQISESEESDEPAQNEEQSPNKQQPQEGGLRVMAGKTEVLLTSSPQISESSFDDRSFSQANESPLPARDITYESIYYKHKSF